MMFPFENCPSPSTNTLLSASAPFISTSVLDLLAGSSTLAQAHPDFTEPSLHDGVVGLVLVGRSETIVSETSASPTDSDSHSRASSSTAVKTGSTSLTNSGAVANTKGPASQTSNGASLISEGIDAKGPPPTSNTPAPSSTHGGKGGQPETSGAQSGAGVIISSARITPTGHWITLVLPTAYVATGGLYEKHGEVYDDGYRQGYQDGCYDHAYATHPASLNGEYFTGYRKGRDSGIRDCRPLDGNDQSGSGWSDDVLLPSPGSAVTLGLWLLVMPCLLTLMLHVL